MIIRGICIEEYGSLKHREFALDSHAVLFSGPNEAGKTTVMSLIRSILFGLPPKQDPARVEPPSGGTYGGALVVEDRSGKRWRIERRFFAGSAAGRSRGGLAGRLLAAEEMPDGSFHPLEDGEAALAGLLGGVSAELFRSVYAFGLSELQELGTLQSEEVSGYLYNAAWGGSGAAIAAAERRIAQEMDRLYRPRGKNQDIALLLKTRDEDRLALRRSKEAAGRYGEWARELARLDAEIRRADEELRSGRDKLNRLERYMRAKEPWYRLQTVLARLRELPEFASFPVGASERFAVLQAERSRLEEELDELTTRLARTEAAAAGAGGPAARNLEEQAASLEALLEKAGVYRESLAAANALRAEWAADGEAVGRLMEQLGAGWTEERLRQFRLTVGMREAVREAKKRGAECELAAETARAELERAEEEWAAAERAALALREQADLAMGVLRSASSGAGGVHHEEALLRTIEQLELAGAEWGRLRQDLRHLRQREEDYRLLRPVEGVAPGSGRKRGAGKRRMGISARRAALLPAAAALALPALLAADGSYGLAIASFCLFAATAWIVWRLPGEEAGSGSGGLTCETPESPFAETRRELERKQAELESLIRSKLSEWEPAMPEAAAALEQTAGLAETLPDYWPEQAKRAADRLRRMLQEFGALRSRCEEAAKAARDLRSRRDAALRRREEAERQRGEWLDGWKSWLAQHGLEPSLTPDGAIEWLQLAEQGKRLAESRQKAMLRLATLENEMKQFERNVLELCRGEACEARGKRELREERGNGEDGLLAADREREAPESEARGTRESREAPEDLQTEAERENGQNRLFAADREREAPESEARGTRESREAPEDLQAEEEREHRIIAGLPGGDRVDPVALLKRKKAEVDEALRRQAELERLLEERAALEADIRVRVDRLARVEASIASLWDEAEANSEEQFRLNAELHAERKALERERAELEASLDAILGRSARTEAESFLESPPEQLERAREETERLLAETENRLDELRDKRGRLRNEMEKLESGEEHAERLQKLHETEAELEQLVRRWAIHALALGLFERTRTWYENERQPAVLSRASRYFAAMTGGRYTRIVSPLGEKRLLAVTPHGEPHDSSRLSRGTAEQLYLAMRFALADEADDRARLPFIMDDVFVNFDRERTERCLQLVSELAERRQVLLFTCHEHVERAAIAAIPGLQLIRMRLE